MIKVQTLFKVVPKGGTTFFLSLTPQSPCYDKELLAHLAWVLNAYLPASTVLKLLAGNKPIPHTIPLPPHLSPGRWKNLIALL